MKQDELSKELDISKSYLSELEAGKKTISLDILDKYSRVFSIPVSSLLLFSENLDSKPTSKTKVNFANKILKLIEWVNLRDDINREA